MFKKRRLKRRIIKALWRELEKEDNGIRPGSNGATSYSSKLHWHNARGIKDGWEVSITIDSYWIRVTDFKTKIHLISLRLYDRDLVYRMFNYTKQGREIAREDNNRARAIKKENDIKAQFLS